MEDVTIGGHLLVAAFIGIGASLVALRAALQALDLI